jgi:hypothetical protein
MAHYTSSPLMCNLVAAMSAATGRAVTDADTIEQLRAALAALLVSPSRDSWRDFAAVLTHHRVDVAPKTLELLTSSSVLFTSADLQFVLAGRPGGLSAAMNDRIGRATSMTQAVSGIVVGDMTSPKRGSNVYTTVEDAIQQLNSSAAVLAYKP